RSRPVRVDTSDQRPQGDHGDVGSQQHGDFGPLEWPRPVPAPVGRVRRVSAPVGGERDRRVHDAAVRSSLATSLTVGAVTRQNAPYTSNPTATTRTSALPTGSAAARRSESSSPRASEGSNSIA